MEANAEGMKAIKTNTTIQEAAKVDKTYVEQETPEGTLVLEHRVRPEHPKDTEIPVYLIQQVKKGTKTIPVRMYFSGPPADVEEDVWYPSVELRMTQDTFDNMDFVPDWKPFDLLAEDGTALRDGVGRQRKGYFYVDWNIMECTEEEDGIFFPLEPVQGKNVRSEMNARNGSKASVLIGGSRRRAAP